MPRTEPPPSIRQIAHFGLVTADIDATERFFVDAFDFVSVERGPMDGAFSTLVGLPNAEARSSRLRLGQQEIRLVAFDPPGAPYPPDSTSTDLWFQHFAIITRDMAAAYKRLEDVGGFRPISEGGPVQLPKSSGGVQAFKFRDSEGHPLELLAFPADGAPPAWQTDETAPLFLGLDHSAISVGSTGKSTAFFEKCFGLKQSAHSENVGPEQARMDDVPDARVTVTGLAPEHTPPHVELLGYAVGARRPIPSSTRANDIAATFFVMETDDLSAVSESLTEAGATFVSPGPVTMADGRRAIAVLDPDGHRFIVEEVTRPG